MLKKLFIAVCCGVIFAVPFAYRHDIAALIEMYRQNRAAPPGRHISDFRNKDNAPPATPQVVAQEPMSYTQPKLFDPQMKKGTVSKTSSTPLTQKKLLPSLPQEFNLSIPFTSQAPYANWDYPYQEACEEAATLMTSWFISGVTSKTPAESDKDILALIEWEKERFGYYEDTTAAETLAIVHEYFKLPDAFVVDDPTVTQIKEYVSQGYPVIVPASGKQLGNPNFRNGGPAYHAIVIRGYTETMFVTNDPGTRKGKNYQYRIETVMRAMHDWNGGDVAHGAKRVVVVKY